LQEVVLKGVREELRREWEERPLPLYYDRFISSETRRLEEAINRNGQRIDELGERLKQVEQRLGSVEERVYRLSNNIRNWLLLGFSLLGLLMTVLRFLH
jgi:chromosome segregation ATPase